MIGTLIGMVQMFANMTDPSKLGPFMATALLATLYGALVANLFCLPIADKLHGKLLDEETNRTLIIDGILMIRDSKSPTLVREMLLAYLPEKTPPRRGRTRPGLIGQLTAIRKAGDGQEETRRRTRRRPRLVRDLRRPDGPDDELLRDARRLFHHGQQQAQSRRRLDARCLRRADRGALFRHH